MSLGSFELIGYSQESWSDSKSSQIADDHFFERTNLRLGITTVGLCASGESVCTVRCCSIHASRSLRAMSFMGRAPWPLGLMVGKLSDSIQRSTVFRLTPQRAATSGTVKRICSPMLRHGCGLSFRRSGCVGPVVIRVLAFSLFSVSNGGC